MSVQLPDPPYPVTTRARGWRFEVDYERMLVSSTMALAPVHLRPWLLWLWTMSWWQAPCGTLDDDNELIAARLGMSLEGFLEVRPTLMRGWYRCSDGRLYHRVVTERVLEMLERRASDAAKKREQREKPAPTTPKKRSRSKTSRVPGDSPGTPSGLPGESGTGTGTGTNHSASKEAVAGGAAAPPAGGSDGGQAGALGPAAPPSPAQPPADGPPAAPAGPTGGLPGIPDPPPPPPSGRAAPARPRPPAKPREVAPSAALWDAYAEAFEARYGAQPVRNATVNGVLSQVVARIGGEAPDVARFFLKSENALYVRATHPVQLLLRDCEGLRTQWVTGKSAHTRPVNESPYEQRMRERVAQATGRAPSTPVVHKETFDVAVRRIPDPKS